VTILHALTFHHRLRIAWSECRVLRKPCSQLGGHFGLAIGPEHGLRCWKIRPGARIPRMSGLDHACAGRALPCPQSQGTLLDFESNLCSAGLRLIGRLIVWVRPSGRDAPRQKCTQSHRFQLRGPSEMSVRFIGLNAHIRRMQERRVTLVKVRLCLADVC